LTEPSEYLWQRAASAAARFHQGQMRKDGRTPYIAHPFRVAMTVRDVFGVDDHVAVAAALLHDVIEDTTADYDDVEQEFGADTARVVASLTKDMRMPEAAREAAYDSQLARAPWQARLVKLADVYDNVSDCLDGAMRKKAAEKARRAVALAGSEPQLKTAVRAVELLLKKRAPQRPAPASP
jgi:guanosine-3',5'-bis(diphosphate) 3'-pyrophosphohydrolase